MVDLTQENWDHREQEEPTYCAMCDRKTSKLFCTIELPACEEYRGNAQVVSRKPIPYHPGRHILRLNRATFRGFDYGVFCKLRCAEEFANAAYKYGLRVKAE